MVGNDFGGLWIYRVVIYAIRNSTFHISDAMGSENETGKCIKVFGIGMAERRRKSDSIDKYKENI